MRIDDVWRTRRPTFSLELMPCRDDDAADQLFRRFEETLPRLPDFVSVTHALNRLPWSATLRMAERCAERWGVPVMPHLACRDLTLSEAKECLETLMAADIANLLVLRGDLDPTTSRRGDFRFASECIAFAREVAPDLCIGAACYPLRHPETRDEGEDLRVMRAKMRSGASFFVTQLYFAATEYQGLVMRAGEQGIDRPMLPGVVLPRDRGHLERLCRFCKMELPESVRNRSSAEAFLTSGHEVLGWGVPGLHVFTLNDPAPACAYLELFD